MLSQITRLGIHIIDYNPFKGKTQAEYIKYIENELQETLFDVSPNVKNVYTSLIAIDENDKQSK